MDLIFRSEMKICEFYLNERKIIQYFDIYSAKSKFLVDWVTF